MCGDDDRAPPTAQRLLECSDVPQLELRPSEAPRRPPEKGAVVAERERGIPPRERCCRCAVRKTGLLVDRAGDAKLPDSRCRDHDFGLTRERPRRSTIN